MKIGRSKETGIWRSATSRLMFKLHNHDSLFVTLGRWRLRIMKPSAMRGELTWCKEPSHNHG